MTKDEVVQMLIAGNHNAMVAHRLMIDALIATHPNPKALLDAIDAMDAIERPDIADDPNGDEATAMGDWETEHFKSVIRKRL